MQRPWLRNFDRRSFLTQLGLLLALALTPLAWDLVPWQPRARIHCEVVKEFRFSADGSTLITEQDTWDATTGERRGCLARALAADAPLHWHRTRYPSLAGFQDGPDLAVWSHSEQKEILRLRETSDAFWDFSPDERLLSVASGGNLRVFDLSTQRELCRVPGADVSFSRFAPNGRYLACGFGDVVVLYDLADGRELGRYPGKVSYWSSMHFHFWQQRITTFDFSLDSTLLAVANPPGIDLIETASGRRLRSLPATTETLCFLPTGGAKGTLFYHSSEGTQLWDPASGRLVASLLVPLGSGLGLPGAMVAPDLYLPEPFSVNGRYLVTTDVVMGDLFIWDLAADPPQLHLSILRTGIETPDGTVLAAFGGDWLRTSGNVFTSARGAGLPVAVRFSPDSKRVAVGGGYIPLPGGVEKFLRGIARLPDPQDVKQVVVIDLESRRLIARLDDASWPEFSPDGTTLATSIDEGSGVELWDLPPRKQLGWLLAPVVAAFVLVAVWQSWKWARRK